MAKGKGKLRGRTFDATLDSNIGVYPPREPGTLHFVARGVSEWGLGWASAVLEVRFDTARAVANYILALCDQQEQQHGKA